MKCLLFVILAGCAVKCDDNNYYVIEMPEDRLEDQERPFSVYWNVPTMQCKSKKIPFENLYEKYGILQNKNDSFRGEEISILYDPGLFPALLKNETSGKFKFRNGGVPQEGDLELHLETFKSVLQQSIPDPDFHGVGIIDFESWRPIFRQNFGVLVPYKDISTEIEKKMHWWWPKQWVQAEAKQRFEEAARTFMQTTLSVAKQMRPKALWGYYGFPYCFNMAGNKMRESCADKVPEENDRAYWLWSESTALYPSVYSSKELKASQLAGLIRGRVKESERVKRKNTPVLPYFWFRYRNGGYFSKEDLNTALETLYKSNASGFIIWGSSNDVNTVSKCKMLRKYLENTLGPAIAAYTKPITKLRDEMPEIPIESTTTKKTDVPTNNKDPEFDWEPPENYAQDIKNYVEEEIKRKGPHFIKPNETIVNVNDSILMDIILNSLIEERNMSKNEMKGLPFVDITTDYYTQNHGKDTSQPVDISTTIVQTTKDTNILSSTESLPTELVDNSHKETKVSSAESLVTKLLQNNQIAQGIGSTTPSTEILPNQETSQRVSTELSVTELQPHHQVIIDLPTSQTTEHVGFKIDKERMSTEFVTLQDTLKNVDLTSKLPSKEFLSYDEKHSSDIYSIGLQDNLTPTLPTESISTEFTNNFQESSEQYSPHSTTNLVAKYISKDISSIEISTTVSTYSSEKSSDKIHQNQQGEVPDSTTESTSVEDPHNHKPKTIAIGFLDNSQGISETTELLISEIDVENKHQDIQKQANALEFIETTTSDSDKFTPSDDKYSDSMDTTSGYENYSTMKKYTENIPFFNQDTFLDNTESPETAINTVFDDKSTHDIFDTTNEAVENISDLISDKEELDSTPSSTTELDQVNVYVL